MTAVNHRVSRNQSMEIAKLFMAVCVCVAHTDAEKTITSIAATLTMPAVAMFFAISGYFSFHVTSAKLFKRLLHIVRLYLIAYAIHLVCNCLLVELSGGSTIAYLRAAVPDLDEVILWSAVQHDSFLGHLWTLASTGICYIILWAYTFFQEDHPVNYTPLYIIAAVFFFGYTLMSAILPAAGITLHHYAFRNAWFLGFPSFMLGIFLRQHQAHIVARFSLTPCKLILATLTLYVLVAAGFQILFPIEVLSLMLLVIAVPRFPNGSFAEKLAARCGIWSTGIYVVHVTIITLYSALLQDTAEFLFGENEAWIQPLIILTLSFAAALVWDSMDRILKKHRQ